MLVAEDIAAFSAVMPSASECEVMLAVLATLHHCVIHPVGRVQAVPKRILFLLHRRHCSRRRCFHSLRNAILHILRLDPLLFSSWRLRLLQFGAGLVQALVHIRNREVAFIVVRSASLMSGSLHLDFDRHSLLKDCARCLTLHVIVLGRNDILVTA